MESVKGQNGNAWAQSRAKFCKAENFCFFHKKMVAELEREAIKCVMNKFTFSPVADARKF